MEKIALWIVVCLFSLVIILAVMIGLYKIGWFMPILIPALALLVFFILKKGLGVFKKKK